jgi:GNAT superfamily N-acetyltransferase
MPDKCVSFCPVKWTGKVKITKPLSMRLWNGFTETWLYRRDRAIGVILYHRQRTELREDQTSKPLVATASFFDDKPKVSHVAIEPATAEDLDELSELLGELFSEESDFRPNKEKQLRGLRLIFEQPNRGRVFVLRRDHSIVGMINLLFTISTAEGGFVILLEDLVIHKAYRDQGYGSQLLEYAIDFARKKNFLRITLLTDRPEIKSQAFFKRHGFFESAMIPMRLLITPEAPQHDLTL